jgi:hypothetical protein
MLWSSRKPAVLLLAMCWAFVAADSHAELPTPPYTAVHTVAAADSAVPVEETLDIAAAGTYQITLTDLGAQLPTPAPLASVQLAITGGSSIVGTPLSAPGSSSFAATAGVYVIHVVGLPGNVSGSGPFGITVSDASHNTVASFSGTLALPQAAAPSNQGVMTGSFTVQTSGNYQVNLSDLQFPATLNTLTLAIVVQGGALLITLPAAGTNTVALQSGVTYDIFAIGQSTASPAAGLYGASVTPSGGGTPVFARTEPVGAVSLVAGPALAAGNYTLTLTDLKLPLALAQLGAVVSLNGQAAAQLNAAGSTPLVATANTYQVFALGLPAASGTGSYALALQPASGPAALSIARAVSVPGGAVAALSYDTQVASGGGYTVNLADFALPAQFVSLSAVAVQNGVSLGSQHGPGALSVVAAVGPVSLLAFAQPAASGSLFGLDLEPSGTTNPVFAITQGLGELFAAQQIAIDTAGTYKVTVSDVGFPSPLANLGVVVTRGANQFGSIFVGGDFSFVATPGNYFVNFIAQPGGSDHAGTYALSIVSAPPAPIVTLTTDGSSVASGSTVDLIWTSQNATACTASGGWTGKQPTSGTATSPALTANTTFTLTCTGAGGSTPKSVNVTVTAAPSGGGGGGALTPELLFVLAAALGARWLPRARRRGGRLSRISHAGFLQC